MCGHVSSQLLITVISSEYALSDNCMPHESIFEKSEHMTMIRCALMCNESPSCAAFGFQESKQSCCHGICVTDHVSYSSHCTEEEDIYTSGKHFHIITYIFLYYLIELLILIIIIIQLFVFAYLNCSSKVTSVKT